MKVKILIPIIFSLIISCNNEKESFNIIEGQVKINGVINNYDGNNKIGRLIYFDAITRIEKNKIIIIDTSGTFSVNFPLIHPIIGSTFLELENNVYYDIYLEPNQNYDVTISGERIIFNGESGIINREIAEYHDSLYSISGSEIEKMSNSLNPNLSIDEYISLIKNIENIKYDFLKNYSKTHNFSEKARILFENEIRYTTAHSWIMYRYNESRKLKDSLPEGFYQSLFAEFTVVHQNEFESRNCNDYIANIVSVLEKKDNDVKSRMQFISSANFFTPEELEFLSKRYSNNPDERETDEYKEFSKKFFTISNRDMFIELDHRFNFLNVLNNLSLLNQNIGRDLVVTQAFSSNYIEKNISPTQSEWKKIDSSIINESIRNYIHSISVKETTNLNKTRQQDSVIVTGIEQVKKKYLDKYLGNVIYIDFYATWCGPCLFEIPYAKELHYKFKTSDVVFLNLCALSSEENWNSLLNNRNILGENFLLSSEEYTILSELFEVKSFPTYVIVDKNGNIVSLKAPRPSSRKEVTDEIKKLL